jgi:hypothetical protein
VTFQGNELHIAPSKYPEVAMPKGDGDGEGDDAADSTKDYSNSPIHRFKVCGAHCTSP